ncbi:HK97 family phage prohead protease [Mesorhizobium sp.]|uniref:HK97 family phage prohead protease n=1 Tax=Mesorhizobium sp. TaxID=1871066 RepID=UPI000FE8232B|nr:HK97 family phage prohead protease [Mesorhizobium sp.]RWP72378.1 MAG: HK97 family phage prohead protease [Mesorhizobium sp.]
MSDDEGRMQYSGGGFISFYDNKPVARFTASEVKRQEAPESRPAVGPRVTLAGYASVYNKVHLDAEGKQIEVFTPGCFARGLHDGRAIRFLVRHREGKCVATSAGSLELLADDIGLAFRVELSSNTAYADEAIALAQTKAASMSVGYRVDRDEFQIIDGHKVRFLRDVSLEEITIAPPGKGAVREAFAIVLDSNSQSLRQLCESKSLANEWGSVAVRRALDSFADRVVQLAEKVSK